MKGAIVFLVVFVLGVVVTLSSPSLPPGPSIYGLLNVPVTSYPVLGIPVTTLAISIFNGVIYGFIVWLAFTLIWAATGRNKNKSVQQNVNINIDDKKKEVTKS